MKIAARFFRCLCGKMHTSSNIWGTNTVCPGCNRKLADQLADQLYPKRQQRNAIHS